MFEGKKKEKHCKDNMEDNLLKNYLMYENFYLYFPQFWSFLIFISFSWFEIFKNVKEASSILRKICIF